MKPLKRKITVVLADGLVRVMEANEAWNVAWDAIERLTRPPGRRNFPPCQGGTPPAKNVSMGIVERSATEFPVKIQKPSLAGREHN